MTNNRVLIIDDDKRLADMLSEYLSGHGFFVSFRLDATSGLAALKAQRSTF